MRAVKRRDEKPDNQTRRVPMRAGCRQSDDFFEEVFQFLLLRGREAPETLVELLGQRRHTARGGFASGRGLSTS